MMLLEVACTAWLALAAVTGAAPAPSPPADNPVEALPLAERDEARARGAWEKGAAAYGEGRFADAIPHFLETYRYSGRPGPLFSLGQAHRHQWEKEYDPRQRQLAIRRYQQYLDAAPDGTRRAETERFIKELLEASELEGPGEAPPPTTALILPRPAAGATATIDGGEPFELPASPEVDPGKHRIVVSAPGFHSRARTVVVPEGSSPSVMLPLDVIKAEIIVTAPEGADLWVDGKQVARLPSRAPVKVDPGVRQIGVARPGRALFIDEIELAPGETRAVKADLERTGLRKVAFAAIAIGSAGIAAAAPLTGLAFRAQAEASAFQKKVEDATAKGEEVPEYNDDLERRNALRTSAIAVGAVGAVLLGTGLILYFVDKPPVASQLRGGPSVGANHVGATLKGRF